MTDSGLYFITAFQLDYSLQPGPYIIFIRPLNTPARRGFIRIPPRGSSSTEPTGKSSLSTPSAATVSPSGAVHRCEDLRIGRQHRRRAASESIST